MSECYLLCTAPWWDIQGNNVDSQCSSGGYFCQPNGRSCEVNCSSSLCAELEVVTSEDSAIKFKYRGLPLHSNS